MVKEARRAACSEFKEASKGGGMVKEASKPSSAKALVARGPC